MSNQYTNNHYVPEWYQSRFIAPGQQNLELNYLHLKPEVFLDSKGVTHSGKSVFRQGFRKCFAEENLYTTTFGGLASTKIEQVFFGDIDRNGRKAVDHFSNFSHPALGKDEFRHLMMYMSTQKLRTPKGLTWLAKEAKTTDPNQILWLMTRNRSLYAAVWTECIWQIAEASHSNTKFIVSDHPVTVYNRTCGPQWCRRLDDPDIRMNGTHTIFPLTLDKVLILTNLSWVRNPYQLERDFRPNLKLYRSTIFKFTDIQTLRYLSEQEVREINFIIKSSAHRYIAAAKEEWLYPEKHVSKSQWNKFGNGYLLMPDPRSVQFGGEIMWGNDNGVVGAIDEYGYRPGEPEYGKIRDARNEFQSFHRFQGEFARLYGPSRRGRSFQMLQMDPEKDTDEYHKYHLSLDVKMKKMTK